MSLQVWLPLTEDLRNQGLSNVTVTNNGATFNSNGKLGGCYTGRIDVSSSIIPTVLNNTEFTVAFWIYIIEVPTASGVVDTYVMACGSGGTRTQFHIAIRQNGAGFAFCFYADDYTFYNTVTDKVGKWMHVVCAFKNNTQIVYVDGIKIGERATAGGLNIAANSVLNIYAAHERLNDIRIYDHALSPLEVKRLAQGLVLHYPLSDAYIESAINLSGGDIDNTCFNGATSKYGYGANTDIYKESGIFQGRECTKVYMGTSGQVCFPYVHFNNLTAAIGSVRTLSFDYYPTKLDKITFYTHNTAGTTVWHNGQTKGTSNGTAIIPVNINHWNHICISVTNTGNATNGWGYMTIGNANHSSTTTDYWLFDNVMIVDGNVEKPFTLGTRSASVITYDCSGLCNNGNNEGTITISDDTPRYKYSTVFDGNVNINTTNPLSSPCIEFTVAGWVNLIDGYAANNGLHIINFNATYSRICISKDNSAVRVLLTDGTSSGTYAGYSSTARASILTANVWNHYAIVFKNGELSIYINGVLDSTQTTYFTTVGFTTSYLGVGTYGSELAKGKVSDLRVYATALSADDVMALYKNAGYVDSDGNVYAYEMTE